MLVINTVLEALRISMVFNIQWLDKFIDIPIRVLHSNHIFKICLTSVQFSL